jgi:hypothetical protein
MVESGNALEYLIDLCRKQGKPMDYFIFNGGGWLVPSDEYQRLVYYSPKKTPDKVEIGRVDLGGRRIIKKPIVLYKKHNISRRLVIWDLARSPYSNR